ncbi:probable polygalacturonase At1g80170 [Durio zibethinus]|uniref:Probable polygalacturonase At1g80170 n=1 Tax=Durio zibethinus TaxID=66656 RepID=A0A6P5WZ26_DURZI|nr:probable polygalacturonase At1g80170 [Durio zibethinus]
MSKIRILPQSKFLLQLSGTIIAPNGPDQWKAADLSTWLAFQGANGLTIDGLGMVDGRGKGWWDRSCKFHRGQQVYCNIKIAENTTKLKLVKFHTSSHFNSFSFSCFFLIPFLTVELLRMDRRQVSILLYYVLLQVLKLENCNNIHMSNIKFHNSPQTHVLILGCQNVDFGFLTIQAPGTSPNTDGIHIQVSRNVSIHNSQFADGDDCISIGDRTSDISITDISCGPGHGVSIGSLGRGGAEVQVNNINVRRVNFRGTTNGVRIKTWQGGRGIVRNVSFSNINFRAVANPIIIDQFYCDIPNSCRKSNTAVHISGVRYSQLFGTSKTKVGINLNCSSNVPCTGITLEDIHLASATSDSQLISSCNNAFGLNRGIIDPKSCLRKII